MPTKQPGVPAPPPPPRGRSEQRPAWEYRSEYLNRSADLSRFGAEGWELVSVAPAGGDMAMFYFKRRRA